VGANRRVIVGIGICAALVVGGVVFSIFSGSEDESPSEGAPPTESVAGGPPPRPATPATPGMSVGRAAAEPSAESRAAPDAAAKTSAAKGAGGKPQPRQIVIEWIPPKEKKLRPEREKKPVERRKGWIKEARPTPGVQIR